jgi:hypothetical protein
MRSEISTVEEDWTTTKELMLSLLVEIRQDLVSGEELEERELIAKKMALYHYQRQLFPLVLPQPAGYLSFDDTVGICAQGWLPDTCAAKNKYFNGPSGDGGASSSSSVSSTLSAMVTENKYFSRVLLCASMTSILLFVFYKIR